MITDARLQLRVNLYLQITEVTREKKFIIEKCDLLSVIGLG